MIEIWIALVGFLLSLYSIYVKNNVENDSKYHAACDLGKNVSCSKAFGSKYGSVFGIENSYIGVLYYPLFALFFVFNMHILLVIAASISLAFSLYLAGISYFKMHNFCLVCNAIYIINIVLFILAL